MSGGSNRVRSLVGGNVGCCRVCKDFFKIFLDG
jgi:hypothetical protein